MTNIRNVAIIAHVDHGKTTLVDKMLHQAKLFRENQQTDDLYLDNNDLERERGITILAKNVSVTYKGVKINIIDTPGHADFGGEVERVLKMADGVILLVDAFEGVMPQTRFVLRKAIGLGLMPVVVVNKVDKENCRPDEVHEEVFDLMFNLEASDEQLQFPTLYGSSKQGWMSHDWKEKTDDITPLLDTILEHVPPAPQKEGVLQFQITSLDYNNFLGRIAIGRVYQGELKAGTYGLAKRDGSIQRVKIKEIQAFEGLGRIPVDSVQSGDVCAVTGMTDFEIGDTLTDLENPEPMQHLAIEEPTLSMLFTINNSPFYGQEGKFVTSRHLRDRLMQETEKNLSLRVKQGDTEDKFMVFGRGILHLSVLIETMRREGYELQVGQPQVIFKEVDGQKMEPYETLVVDVPAELSGKIIELASQRKGEMKIMEPRGDVQHLEFEIPSRGLFGLRNQALTATQGEAVLSHTFNEYGPVRNDIPQRQSGSLISMDTGPCTAYALDKLQDRGIFFAGPNDELYAGQVIGEHSRGNDLAVNLQKGKQLTNMRASGSDKSAKIAPKKELSLEEALEFIKGDEYVEITPENIRMRKIKFKP